MMSESDIARRLQWPAAIVNSGSRGDVIDYRAMLARVRFSKRNLDSIPEDWPEGRGNAAYLLNLEMESGWTLRYRDAVIDQAMFRADASITSSKGRRHEAP